jgi:hypothetical protein
MDAFSVGKISKTIWGPFVIWKKNLPKENNRPIGENSPNPGSMLSQFSAGFFLPILGK